MDSELDKPWETEFKKNKKSVLFDHFVIIDESNLIQGDNDLKIKKIDNFIEEIEKSNIKTGIMIANLEINQSIIYLFLLDDKIFIVIQKSLIKYKDYFNKNKNILLFFTKNCKKNFEKVLNGENPNINDIDIKIDNQDNYNKIIKNEITKIMIKKIQCRTLQVHQNPLPKEYNADYIFDDNYIFINLVSSSNNAQIYYNVKCQFLNILKSTDSDEEEKKHEIKFYQKINNNFPFICKIFGKKKLFDIEYYVIEYIEGEILYRFIKNNNEIDFATKLKITLEILFAVYYIHHNGIMLRDLNYDNIIIDLSNNDAYLIDFNKTKTINSIDVSKEDSNYTNDLGINNFLAPEIFQENEQTKNKSKSTNFFPVDCFSVGMIIHYIFTGKEYDYTKHFHEIKFNENFNIANLKSFPKFPDEYNFIFDVIKNCFEVQPYLRYEIKRLYMNLIFNRNYKDPEKLVQQIMPGLMNEFIKYRERIDFNIIPDEVSVEYNLGLSYYLGEAVRKNDDIAIEHLMHESNKDNKYAQFLLGKIYFEGIGVVKDIDKSIHHLEKSAEQNFDRAQYYLGLIYLEDEHKRKDIKKAKHYFELAAKQNNPDALFYMGYIYYHGIGVDENMDEAIKFFKLSAKKNDPAVFRFLGYIYYYGSGVDIEKDKAIYYYTCSALLNNRKSQLFLGNYYYKEKNVNEAINWLLKSAGNDEIDANYKLGFILQEKKYPIDDIIKYYKNASSFNCQYAKNNLAIIYKHGINVKQNLTNAITYFNEAIEQKNDKVSMYNLSHTYFFYINNDENIDESIKLLAYSSNHGFSQSTKLLCLIFLKNYKNIEHGDKLFKKILGDKLVEIEKINEAEKTKKVENMYWSIMDIISKKRLNMPENIDNFYTECKNIDFVYNASHYPIDSNIIFDNPKDEQANENHLTPDFYDAFQN